MYYQECVLKQYRALREQGLNVDVISMEHVLDGYKFVAVPMAYLFCDGYEEKLRDYVKQGGTPYGLMDVTGIRSTAWCHHRIQQYLAPVK